MDATRKYFSPRLLDYIVVTGARQPSRTTPVQPPELLRRYPTEDHPDFPLPLDVVFFCQPEGCVLVGTRRTSLRESTPFVFALTEKDTSRVRYGICVNFYRPIDRADGFSRGSRDQSSFEGGDAVLPEVAGPAPPVPARRKKLSSHSLVSLCIISHHPFFSTFRECLFTLRKLLDSSNERLLFGLRMAGKSPGRDSVWSVFLGRVTEGISSAVLHEVREIETWMLRLLSAPVPVPGKTRVEVAILPRSVERPLVFALPDHTRFSLVDFPLHLPLELLGVDTCMKVLTCIILEHKLVLQSRDYNALSMSVMAFVTMIYPLEYMFPVIPLLPTCMASAEQLLLAPTPYIIGVPATFFKLKRSFCLPDDVWLVDLDSNSVVKPPAVEDLPPLPEPEGTHLLYHLKQALASMSINPQPIRNLDKIQPRAVPGASTLPEKPEQQPPTLSGFNPFIYGNDIDSVDVATRIAMVRFFNSAGVLAHFMEHTRTLRLYPRPVIAFMVNSFLHSRAKISSFLRKFVRTQAVEFYAEWSLCPTNVAFLRVHTGVFDPAVIGDKGKWYCHQLEPIYFDVWSDSCTLTTNMAAMGQTDEASTGESGSESDDASSTSSSYSSLSDFVCDMVEFNGENVGGAHVEEASAAILDRADYNAVFNPPVELQMPDLIQQTLERTDSRGSLHESGTSSSPNSSLSSPSGQPHGDVSGGVFAAPRTEGQEPSESADNDAPAGGSSSNDGEPHTPSTIRSGPSRSPVGSVSSGRSTPPEGSSASGRPMGALGSLAGGVLSRGPGSGSLTSQGSQGSLFEAVAREAKEVAREASKAAAEVSRSALEATKPAREAGRKTLMKALSDRDREKQDPCPSESSSESQFQTTQLSFPRRDSGSLITTMSNELNGFAAHTSNVIQGISGLFSERKGRMSPTVKGKERAPPFGPFPKANMGRRGPVERTPLIKHITPQQAKRLQSQEPPKSLQTFEEQSTTQSDNQQFLKEVLNAILAGEGIKWFKQSRIKRLMEDESYRNFVVSKLNRTLERRVGPDGLIKDVMISKPVYKGTLKMLQMVVSGLEQSYTHYGIGGMASALQVCEIAHTHFWSKDIASEQGLRINPGLPQDANSVSSKSRPQSTEPELSASRKNSLCAQDGKYNRSQDISPYGSGEHLNRYPTDPARMEDVAAFPTDLYRAGSPMDNSPHREDRGSFDRGSLLEHRFSLSDVSQHTPPQMNVIPSTDSIDHHDEASDMFRGLMNAKKLMLSKITSIDSEVSEAGMSQSSDLAVPSGSVSDTGSVTMNPAFFRQARGGSNASFRSTVSDSEVEAGGTGGFLGPRQKRAASLWSGKTSLSGGFRFSSATSVPGKVPDAGQGSSPGPGPSTPTRTTPPPHTRTYIYQGLIGKDRSTLWDEPQFWEDTFFDAVSQERDLVGVEQQPGEQMKRYRTLSSSERKRLEHDEDRLLSTLLSNVIAFMLMMEVNIEEIRRRARRLLGKCHISLVYSAELNTILDSLEVVVDGKKVRKSGNEIDLRPLGSRQMQSQCFTVHMTADSNEVRFLEVRDDGLVLRAANGHVLERWWYERLVNMSYCPKNKVLCLWRRSQGQTQVHKYYTRKCKDMYYSIKDAMDRAAARGKVVTSGTELGGEFPVLDMTTREGGILQVCMEGVGLLFANSKFFVRLENIKRCYTQREHIFVLEEYNPKTRHTIERRYESKMASEICYAVLCVFSYLISGDPRPAQPGAGSSRS